MKLMKHVQRIYKIFITVTVLLAISIVLVSAMGEETTAPQFIGRVKEVNRVDGTITVQNEAGYKYIVKAEGFILNEKVVVNTATLEVERYVDPPLTLKLVIYGIAEFVAICSFLYLFVIFTLTGADVDMKDPLWYIPVILLGLSILVTVINALFL